MTRCDSSAEDSRNPPATAAPAAAATDATPNSSTGSTGRTQSSAEHPDPPIYNFLHPDSLRPDFQPSPTPVIASHPDSSAEDPTTSTGAALLLMARRQLAQQAKDHPDRTRRDRTKLTLNIDPHTGWARLPDNELLPPAITTSKFPLPAGLQLRPLTPADLTQHDSGRNQREPTQNLRDLITTLDGEHCTIPACTHTRHLHTHHIQWWSHGGNTDLANLTLICSQHHTAIHNNELKLTFNPTTRTLTATATGAVLHPRPTLPWQSPTELDPDQHDNLTQQPLATYDNLNLRYAVMVLLQDAA